MTTNIFKKIIEKEIPADIVWENETYLVFKDINPQMETHLLVIPKKEIPMFHTALPQDRELIKGMFDIAWMLIDKHTLSGCQLHINSGADHDQLVPHIHMHLMSHLPLN